MSTRDRYQARCKVTKQYIGHIHIRVNQLETNTCNCRKGLRGDVEMIIDVRVCAPYDSDGLIIMLICYFAQSTRYECEVILTSGNAM